MHHSTLRYTSAPTQQELDSAYPARWRTQWTHGSTLLVHAADTDWHALTDAVGTGPVLYETNNAEAITVYAGERQWSLRHSGTSWHLTAAGPLGGQRPVDRMVSWSRPPFPGAANQRSPMPQRGFLTATLKRTD